MEQMQQNQSPKYAILVEWLLEQINNKKIKSGEKIYSENQLSSMFSISRHTVRHAISILENKGILKRIKGKGTFVSSHYKQANEKNFTIGVVITYLNDYIFPNIINGIHDHLTKNGYSMSLAITNNKQELEAEAINDMLKRGVDGLIIEPAKSALPIVNLDLFETIYKTTPCIMLNGYFPNMDFKKIVIADEACGTKAVDMAFLYNHKQIAGIFKSDDIQGHLRYLGYIKGLKKHGITPHSNNCLWFTTEDVTQSENIFTSENDKRILNVLKGCSAVICYNDQIAVKLIDVLRRSNINLPQELSIISFDDSALATVTTPTLTSFKHPKEEMGIKAAKLILDIINNNEIEDKIFIPQLTMRNSLV